MKSLFRSLGLVFVALSLTILPRPAAAQETIKIAYIDPFSGPFASGGDEFLKVFSYILAKVNADGGALGKKFEIVPFDDKLQPAEALIALKNATDQGLPFVMQCTGSNAGAALLDGVSKQNARNPDNRRPIRAHLRRRFGYAKMRGSDVRRRSSRRPFQLFLFFDG